MRSRVSVKGQIVDCPSAACGSEIRGAPTSLRFARVSETRQPGSKSGPLDDFVVRTVEHHPIARIQREVISFVVPPGTDRHRCETNTERARSCFGSGSRPELPQNRWRYVYPAVRTPAR